MEPLVKRALIVLLHLRWAPQNKPRQLALQLWQEHWAKSTSQTHSQKLMYILVISCLAHAHNDALTVHAAASFIEAVWLKYPSV